MELSVLVQQTPGNGFRAWCGEPIPAAAEGATREEALAKLRTELEAKTRGVEVVRLHVGVRTAPASPVWPDDAITADWLAGIVAARRSADAAPEPWADPPAGRP